MKKNRIIAVIALLMIFIFLITFVSFLTDAIIPDNSIYYVFMHMVFLVILGICFFPFSEIILSTHKLE
ncbi:MAG: hypothetical protein PHI04_04935 [Clostridiaceae bacterium]|nr:hypothetical protein [Clostridiaceae bacterium]HNQ69670.1 hypothetical protein [Bacteroidales bacterium]HNT02241.1 hypothetical protein [Bacillota bacterium]HPY57032.1 hypothetical protein [Sedimentibacter sp.]HPL98452.1 hypothetical protein [Bacillota bacterium]